MLQQDPSSAGQPSGARCADHVDRPATSICTRCGSYACTLCRNEGPDGREYCERCISSVPSAVLAEPGTRLAAHIVDSFAPTLPLFGFLFLGAMIGAATGKGADAVIGILMLVGVVGSFGVIGYQLYLLSTCGQTIGKRMLGIKVIRTDGSPVDLVRLILLRNLVPLVINLGCGLFSLVDALCIFTAERRCLHDHIADTQVIKVDAPPG